VGKTAKGSKESEQTKPYTMSAAARNTYSLSLMCSSVSSHPFTSSSCQAGSRREAVRAR
jgi:hypothetical protein